MNRRILIAGAFVLLTGCGAPVPDGDVDTYCPSCYERIQDGQAFVPVERPMPSGYITAAGASR